MQRKLLATAVALTTIGLAQADSSFLSADPVEVVIDKDTAFDNPAFLMSTKNQVAISDFGSAGYVFNAFGQKMAVHTGRNGSNALDAFWAGNLGFGQLGVRIGYERDSNNGLAETSYDTFDGAQADYTYFSDESDTTTIDVGGNDTASLRIDDNVDNASDSELQIETGFNLTDLPLSGTLMLALPSDSSEETFNFVDTLNTDGQTTATYREQNTVEQSTTSERDGGLVAELTGRYKLNNQLYVTGELAINNENTLNRTVSKDTQVDTDLTGPTVDVNETTELDTQTLIESAEMTLIAGLDYRKFVGPAMFKIQPSLTYTSSSLTTTDKINKSTFVDALDATNNVTNATGETDVTFTETTQIAADVYISSEFLASEKWTWRAGALVEVMDYSNSKTRYTQNKVDQAGTGYEKDYISVTADGGTFSFLENTYTINLGNTYKPNDNVMLDMNIETNGAALSAWTAHFGLTVLY